MKKFRVLIIGSNFLMEDKGEIQKLGFQATRYVEALSEGVAEQKALAVINADTDFINRVCNTSSNPPFMMVRDIEEIKDFPSMSQNNEEYKFTAEGGPVERKFEFPRFFRQLFGRRLQ